MGYPNISERNMDLAELGLNGADYITDTIAHTGRYVVLQVLTDAVIGAITYIDSTKMGGTTLIGATIPAGTILYVFATSITLTSGTLIAYKG